MTKTGLVMGAFCPMHVGHEALLRAAANNCDHVRVLLGDSDAYTVPATTRAGWINHFLAFETGKELTHPWRPWEVILDREVPGEWATDEHGTVTDERFWDAWLRLNSNSLKSIDVVFGSDRYVGEVAKRIGARWFPVDPQREFLSSRATDIRNHPDAYFGGHVSRFAKEDLALKVAIVGPESTGKSTLVKTLGMYGTTVPEWGRTICEVQPELGELEFKWISTQQDLLIRNACQFTRNGTVITDTEAITTRIFMDFYKKEERWLDATLHNAAIARVQRIDAYIYLAPTVPLVQDGTRVLNQEQRENFGEVLLNRLRHMKKKVFVIDSPDHPKRTRDATQIIAGLQRDWKANFKGMRTK